MSFRERWYWDAFDELEAQGHLDHASSRLNGGDACGRLSAQGRHYLAHPEEYGWSDDEA